MPALGFETFLDISAFEGPEPGRRYVSDQAVVDMVTKQLALNGQDTFVFAITMANHSPWSRLARPADVVHPDWPVFDGFLKGLGETDTALGRMAAVLSQKPGPALLAVFGDHQPAFPRLFRDLGHSDRTTDYLIWRPEGSTGERRDIAVHDLPGLILRHARSATPTGRELANSVR